MGVFYYRSVENCEIRDCFAVSSVLWPDGKEPRSGLQRSRRGGLHRLCEFDCPFSIFVQVIPQTQMEKSGNDSLLAILSRPGS